MFLDFYGLKQQPFGVTPDPSFLYLSPAHREALASLYYGIEAGRGFLSLIAKPGMGKTSLLFHLLHRFQNTARTAFVFQTQCTSREFMRFLLLEVDCEIHEQQDLVSMHDLFNRCLLREARAGRRVIIVIDEAQNLDPSVLETVRLLSDFETPHAKLLQIVMAGQPELADKLARPSLTQLRQRISLLSSLEPLPLREVERYIEHRLKVAGHEGGSMFTPGAQKLIWELSKGIPRSINNFCFNAMSLGCALQRKTIDVDLLQEVASDFDLSGLISQSDTIDTHFLPAASAFREVVNASAMPRPEDAQLGNNALPRKPSRPEFLTPADAQEYLRKIGELLKTQHVRAN